MTATGLNLQLLGGMQIAVDGREIELAQTMSYKGMMLSGVPNLAMTLGYTNASWTLKCDLTCEYVCRLLKHMDEHGYRQCTPHKPRLLGQRGTVHRLLLRIHSALDPPFPEAGLRSGPGACTRTTRSTS